MKYTQLFSSKAQEYAQFRPGYPDELFDYLASLCTERKLAWDCATGNGQTAISLTKYFDRVIATDSSESQLSHAKQHPKINYRPALAENCGLANSSTNLITVSSAVHWFDFDKFYAEVKRVGKPKSIIAVWCYGLLNDEEDILN